MGKHIENTAKQIPEEIESSVRYKNVDRSWKG